MVIHGRNDLAQHVSLYAKFGAYARCPYEHPLVLPQEGQAKQLPARCIWTPHW